MGRPFQGDLLDTWTRKVKGAGPCVSRLAPGLASQALREAPGGGPAAQTPPCLRGGGPTGKRVPVTQVPRGWEHFPGWL